MSNVTRWHLLTAGAAGVGVGVTLVPAGWSAAGGGGSSLHRTLDADDLVLRYDEPAGHRLGCALCRSAPASNTRGASAPAEPRSTDAIGAGPS